MRRDFPTPSALAFAFGTAVLGAALIASCSESRPRTSGAASDGIDSSFPSPRSDGGVVVAPPADGPICIDSALEGPIVRLEITGEAAPAPKGGKVVPGKYFLTSITLHTGDAGRTPTTRFEQIALRVTETSIEFSEREGRFAPDGGLATDDRENKGMTYATAGTSLRTRGECPAPSPEGDQPYTATDNEITFFASPVFVRVFTRQP